MKSMTIIGIVLIVIGVVALVLQGITFVTGEKVAKLGPLEVTKETKRTIPLPPILGALLLVGGIALVVVGGRRS